MPSMITKSVEIQAVRTGDTVGFGLGSERKVGAVKTGTKWVEVRDESGKLIWRYERGTLVGIARLEKTEEEREAERREYCTMSLTKTLEDAVNSKPGDILIQSINEARTKGYVEEVDHWKLDSFLSNQAVRKVYLEIKGNVGRKLKDGTEADVITAFAIVIGRRNNLDNLRYPRDPMSRSTSVLSNLYEDLNEWAYDKVAYDCRYEGFTVIKNRIAELNAMDEAN